MLNMVELNNFLMDAAEEIFGYPPKEINILVFDNSLVIIRKGLFNELHGALIQEGGSEKFLESIHVLFQHRKELLIKLIEKNVGKKIKEKIHDINVCQNQCIEIFRF